MLYSVQCLEKRRAPMLFHVFRYLSCILSLLWTLRNQRYNLVERRSELNDIKTRCISKWSSNHVQKSANRQSHLNFTRTKSKSKDSNSFCTDIIPRELTLSSTRLLPQIQVPRSNCRIWDSIHPASPVWRRFHHEDNEVRQFVAASVVLRSTSEWLRPLGPTTVPHV